MCRHEIPPEGLYYAYCSFGGIIEVQNMPYKIKNKLFEPFGHMMPCPKIVHDDTNPARQQHSQSSQEFTGQGDGLLQNVEHAPKGANQTS